MYSHQDIRLLTVIVDKKIARDIVGADPDAAALRRDQKLSTTPEMIDEQGEELRSRVRKQLCSGSRGEENQGRSWTRLW
eukprot:2705-Heterococcus_DN1.PRE.9